MAFERPTLEDLLDRVELETQTRLGVGPFLARSPLAVLSRVVAGLSHELHGHLQWNADQVLPTTGDSATVERWATLYGLARKAAVAATGSVTFTGTNGAIIPAGTTVQRQADSLEFTVDAEVTIAGGTATAAVTAATNGTTGNSVAGTVLQLVAPVSGVTASLVVAAGGLTGGVDQETDSELLARLLVRIQTPPQGGAAADYVGWALEVSEVTRAFCLPNHLGIGTVGVTFLVDDNATSIIPDAAKVAEVQAAIDLVRPVTAEVTVFAPAETVFNPQINLTPNTSVVQDAVTASIADLLLRVAEPGGTLLVSQVREAISNAAGEEDHVLTFPTADLTVAAGTILTMGTPVYS